MMRERDSKLAVVKVGGDILLDTGQSQGLANNIKDLLAHNWSVVVLHGGGPQVNALQSRLGLEPRKVGGRRITSAADLQVVKQAIAGEVNVDLVATLLAAGIPAFGCHGASGRLISATRRPPRVVSGAGSAPIDFGEVGDVHSINTALLEVLLGAELVPVIATLGVGERGHIFNINADTTVVQIARAMNADVLLLTTAIGGIFRDLDDPQSRIAKITPSESKHLIDAGVIVGGMIPKVEEALSVLDQGVGAVAIVAGAQPGAFMSAADGRLDSGTLIQRV